LDLKDIILELMIFESYIRFIFR